MLAYRRCCFFFFLICSKSMTSIAYLLCCSLRKESLPLCTRDVEVWATHSGVAADAHASSGKASVLTETAFLHATQQLDTFPHSSGQVISFLYFCFKHSFQSDACVRLSTGWLLLNTEHFKPFSTKKIIRMTRMIKNTCLSPVLWVIHFC